MGKLSKSLKLMLGVALAGGGALVAKNYLASKKAKELFPALGSYVLVDSLSLHYLTEGEGDSIVLIHGEKGDIYDFYLSDLWNNLKSTNKVTAIDRPGYGSSTRDTWKDYGYEAQGKILNQAISELKLEKPLLVGYKESSGIVLSMIMQEPTKYRGAVLIGEKPVEFDGLNDKISSVPVLGKTYLWTVAPILEENKLKKELPQSEYSEKVLLSDLLPSKLISASENKLFMNEIDLDKMAESMSELDIPLTLIYPNPGNTRSLFDYDNLRRVFKNSKIIYTHESDIMSILNSDKVFYEIAAAALSEESLEKKA